MYLFIKKIKHDHDLNPPQVFQRNPNKKNLLIKYEQKNIIHGRVFIEEIMYLLSNYQLI